MCEENIKKIWCTYYYLKIEITFQLANEFVCATGNRLVTLIYLETNSYINLFRNKIIITPASAVKNGSKCFKKQILKLYTNS